MDEKQKKLAQVDEFAANLGLTRDEVIEYFYKLPPIREPKKSQSKINITQVKVGMIWYEDDTFSFERLPNKKIKAVVESVDYLFSTICGDLTASELFEFDEQLLSWDDAKKYIENFSYPFKENERIVWYYDGALRNVYDEYFLVKKTFKAIGKKSRTLVYWTRRETTGGEAWCIDFHTGKGHWRKKELSRFIRPVLALKVE